jgi:hypothetical protein
MLSRVCSLFALTLVLVASGIFYIILWPWEPALILLNAHCALILAGAGPQLSPTSLVASHTHPTCVLCVHYHGYLHPWSQPTAQ